MMNALEKARAVVEAALEVKAEDVVALDIRGLSSFADSFVVILNATKRLRKTLIGVECFENDRLVALHSS